MSAYNGPTRLGRAHSRQMAHPALLRTPDDGFVWAEDLTRLTRREVLRMAIGTVIAVVVVWGFLIGLLSLAA